MNKTKDYNAEAPVAGILLLGASVVILVLFFAGCLVIWAVRRASRRPSSRPGCLALGLGAARWARAARDLHGANQIGLVVRLSKTIFAKHLHSAVARVEARHKVLRLGLPKTSTRELCPVDQRATQITEAALGKPSLLPAYCERALMDPAAPGQGPFRVHLVRFGNDPSCAMVCLLHHFAGDGVSLGHLVAELLGYLDNNNPGPLFTRASSTYTPPGHAAVLETIKNGALARLAQAGRAAISGCVRAITAKKHPSALRSYLGRPPSATSLTNTTYHARLRLPPDRFAELRNRARSRRVRIDDALQIVVMLAFHKHADLPVPRRASLEPLINLRGVYRRSRVQNTELGNHAGLPKPVLFDLPSPPEDASAASRGAWMWSCAKQYGLERRRKGRSVHKQAVLIKSTLEPILSLPVPVALSPPYIYSNWGRLPTQTRYSTTCGVLSVVPLINLNYIHAPYVAITGHAGALDLTVAASRRCLPPDKTDGLRDAINQQLLLLFA